MRQPTEVLIDPQTPPWGRVPWKCKIIWRFVGNRKIVVYASEMIDDGWGEFRIESDVGLGGWVPLTRSALEDAIELETTIEAQRMTSKWMEA